MSIYDTQKINNTQETSFNNQAKKRRDAIIEFAYSLIETYLLFWNDKELTPQEHCDRAGNEAILLFSEHQAGVQFVLSRMPNICEVVKGFERVMAIPEGREVTINEDGRITIK